MVRNPDVLAALGERKGSTFLVGFAAETDDHEAQRAREARDANISTRSPSTTCSGERGFGTGENALALLWGERRAAAISAAPTSRTLAAVCSTPSRELMAMLVAIDVGNTETKLGCF